MDTTYGGCCFLIGAILSASLISVAIKEKTTPNSRLHKVGIERIEECHNTKSNWYEIVWMEVK